MDSMREIILKLLCVCAFAILLAVPAYARGAALNLTQSQVTDDAITVSVDISENSGAAMLQFAIGFDPAKLEVQTVSVGNVFAGKSAPTINTRIAGRVYFAWDALESLQDSGTLMVLRFKKLEKDGNTSVFIDLNEEFVVFNENFEEIETSTPELAVPLGKENDAVSGNKITTRPSAESIPTGSNNGLSLNKNKITLSKGETYLLTVAEAAEALVWESSNESVATVQDGTVTALDEGNAIITAFSENGLDSASCVVTVNPSRRESMYTLVLYIGAIIVTSVIGIGVSLLCVRRKRRKKEI